MPASTQFVYILKDGWDIFFGLSTLLIAVVVAFFTAYQSKINKRLKDLQDRVGITIVPSQIGLAILVMNVGKINLHLSKYEIGSKTENFPSGELPIIPAGTQSYFQIEITEYEKNKKMPVKLFLIDDFNKKYISNGHAVVEEYLVPIPPIQQAFFPTQTAPTPSNIIKAKVRTWAYKTEAKNWEL